MGSCVAPFKDALDQEVERDLEVQRLARLEGQTVQILQKEAFLEAAAVAMVSFTKKMEFLIGSIGQVLDVDTHFLTAQVKFPKEEVKFPLEALATREGTQGAQGTRTQTQSSPQPFVAPGALQRTTMCLVLATLWAVLERLQHQEPFWNSAKGGLKTAAILGFSGAWCYTAPAKQNLRGFIRYVFSRFLLVHELLREILMLHKYISLSGFNNPVERQLLVLKTLSPRNRQLDVGALCLEDDDCQTLEENPQRSGAVQIWS